MTIDAATHRALAIEANNSTWDHLSKPAAELDADGAEEMTRRAYAAAYHWARAERATVANEARAEWLLAKVWIARGNGALALWHAQRCADACTRGELVDFDLAYAHEVLARAHACLGDRDAARRHRDLAAVVVVADAGDREQVVADLAAEPWFGA